MKPGRQYPPASVVVAAVSKFGIQAKSNAIMLMLPLLVIERGWPLTSVAGAIIAKNTLPMFTTFVWAGLAKRIGARVSLAVNQSLLFATMVGLVFVPNPLTLILLRGAQGALPTGVLIDLVIFEVALEKADQGLSAKQAKKALKAKFGRAFALIAWSKLLGKLSGLGLFMVYGWLGWMGVTGLLAAISGLAALLAVGTALVRAGRARKDGTRAAPEPDKPGASARSADAEEVVIEPQGTTKGAAASPPTAETQQAQTAHDAEAQRGAAHSNAAPLTAPVKEARWAALRALIHPAVASLVALSLAFGSMSLAYVSLAALTAFDLLRLSPTLVGAVMLAGLVVGLLFARAVPALVERLDLFRSAMVGFALVLAPAVVAAALPLSAPTVLLPAMLVPQSVLLLTVVTKTLTGKLLDEEKQVQKEHLVALLKLFESGLAKFLGGVATLVYASAGATAAYWYVCGLQVLSFTAFVGASLALRRRRRSSSDDAGDRWKRSIDRTIWALRFADALKSQAEARRDAIREDAIDAVFNDGEVH